MSRSTPTEPLDVRVARAKDALGRSPDADTERRTQAAADFLRPARARRTDAEATLKLTRAEHTRFSAEARERGVSLSSILRERLGLGR